MTHFGQLAEALQLAADQAIANSFDRAAFAANLTLAFAGVRKQPPLPDLVSVRLEQLAKLASRVTVSVEGGRVEVIPDSEDHAVFQSITFGCDWHDPIDIDNLVKASLRGE